jgi:hypothetical protein
MQARPHRRVDAAAPVARARAVGAAARDERDVKLERPAAGLGRREAGQLRDAAEDHGRHKRVAAGLFF